jgi:hypothetical protein
MLVDKSKNIGSILFVVGFIKCQLIKKLNIQHSTLNIQYSTTKGSPLDFHFLLFYFIIDY